MGLFKESRSKLIILFLIPIIAIVFSLVLEKTVAYTSQSDFCNKCHSMSNYYNSWAKSKHHKIACFECHTDSGTIGLIKAKLGGIEEVFITIMKGSAHPKDLHAYERCKKCHNQFSALTSSNKNIIFKHVDHLKTGDNCKFCHTNLVHGQQPAKNKDFCFTCHQKHKENRAPVEECSRCHRDIDRFMPNSHNSTQWSITHGQVYKTNKKQCIKCHQKGSEESLCKECHRVFRPHPSNWLGQHSAQAKSQGKQFCINCHSNQPIGSKQAKACISCHGLNMPHPAGWVKNHGKSDAQKCAYCHSPQNPANPKASWAKENYCDSCHKRDKVHGPNWIYQHKQEGERSVCTTCHIIEKFCTKCHRM